jgi:hypothetical protein
MTTLADRPNTALVVFDLQNAVVDINSMRAQARGGDRGLKHHAANT